MVSVLDRVRDNQLEGPARRAAVLVASFGAWTALVWLGRLRNVVLADDLSGWGRTWRLVLTAAFLAGAADVLVRLWQSRSRIRVRRDRTGALRAEVPRLLLRSVALLAVLTIVVWVYRVPATLLGDHDAGFKVVHTVLAVASIALAVAAWQAVLPRSLGRSGPR